MWTLLTDEVKCAFGLKWFFLSDTTASITATPDVADVAAFAAFTVAANDDDEGDS